jgi:molybdate transport system ATP-binding protein
MLPGLYLVTGPNGSGKSHEARRLAEITPGARLLSAETQQAFYERELAEDESNFRGGADLGRTVRQLLGDAGVAHPLCRAFRLDGLLARGYRQLSTGESRKVLLLRALLEQPSLLVFDEPFEGLDHAACGELRHALEHLAESLPVVVAGTFAAAHPDTARLLPLHLLREVTLLGAHGGTVSCSDAEAWLAHASEASAARPAPPVDDGPWHQADPSFAPGTPLIALENGRIAYGEQVVFDGLNLTVRAGEHTLIEGPNGSGKSSLLELFTGDHPQAYANDLTLFGRRRGTGESVWDIKRSVGLVSGRLHRDYRVSASVETVLMSGLFDSIGLYETPGPRARTRGPPLARLAGPRAAPGRRLPRAVVRRAAAGAGGARRHQGAAPGGAGRAHGGARRRQPRPRLGIGGLAVYADGEHRAFRDAPPRRARVVAGAGGRAGGDPRQPGSAFHVNVVVVVVVVGDGDGDCDEDPLTSPSPSTPTPTSTSTSTWREARMAPPRFRHIRRLVGGPAAFILRGC